MLIKFAVTNYRGFAKRIEWDLTKAGNYEFNTYAIKDGVVKNGIIYGPNGSGKTNFGLAIFDIENHLSQKNKKGDYYRNFVCARNPEEPVAFEYTFRFGKQIVAYNYSKNHNGALIAEQLQVDGKNIFKRQTETFTINNKTFPMDKNVKLNLQNNDNNVSIVNFLLTSYPLDKDNYLMKLQQFVGSMLWFRNLDVREYIGLETGVTIIDEYIISNDLLNDFSKFLQDISEQTFQFEPDAVNKQLLCNIGGTLIPFNDVASTGTRSLMLLYYWLKKMSETSFVFIDEFDAFYHFKLSLEVCKRLFNLDCQVYTSSHNTFLMTNDLLRPDCNFILDDNKIKPLNECTEKELRFGHNIEKLFRGNAFRV
ncbi:MAG: ATP-binding protein [Bacteroides sp.]|nr:ATP-binding protein [Bacteroides sp.]